MDLIQQSELEVYRAKAAAAIASFIKTADWYIEEANKSADAAETADGEHRATLINKANRNKATAERIAKEAEDIGDYIKALELAISKEQEHIAAAHEAGLRAGFKASEAAAANSAIGRNTSEAMRARDWVARHIGHSTEGEWVNGVHISQLPPQQPTKITSKNISSLQ